MPTPSRNGQGQISRSTWREKVLTFLFFLKNLITLSEEKGKYYFSLKFIIFNYTWAKKTNDNNKKILATSTRYLIKQSKGPHNFERNICLSW